jgi:NADPH-dependent 2,4-dienoyl-CoA reductase/sulfur reductase-like enzyme
MSCVVNVAAAQEDRVAFEPRDRVGAAKKVLVVGGGPAGLEAARTLALRGHRVLLREASRRLGGQVALAARAPHRADVGQIVRWLEAEVLKLGVDVECSSPVDADVVAELAPDEVVIATGASPRSDGFQVSTPAQPIPGHDLPHVLDAWRLFGVGAQPTLRGPALVFDDTGTFEAISAADALLAAGLPVTFVSRFEQLGQSLPYPPVTVGAARERLMSGQFDFVGGHYLRRITPDAVEIGVLFTERVRRVPARTVVLASFHEPNRRLANEVADGPWRVHNVGDVLGRSGLMHAIHSAAEVARKL